MSESPKSVWMWKYKWVPVVLIVAYSAVAFAQKQIQGKRSDEHPDLAISLMKASIEAEKKDAAAPRTVYQNKKYGYAFSTVSGEKIVSLDDRASADVAFSVAVNAVKGHGLFPYYMRDANEYQIFTVTALDPARLKGYKGFEDNIERYKLPLADYVNYLKEHNDATNVLRTRLYEVDGVEAYVLIVENAFFDGDAALTIREATAFIYTEHNGMKFQIRNPAAAKYGGDILDSFTFVKT